MTSPTHIVIVLGTRPEIIKLAPVIEECQARNIPFSILHTGQHYSDRLDATFFNQLDLPAPDHNLLVGSGSHGEQTGKMIVRIEEYLRSVDPNITIVQGDTNSVLAGAIVTSKLDIELGHVEAGLRSFEEVMPEEINRIIADHVSDYLFAPTDTSADQLKREGIPEKNVFVTGNTIVDAVTRNKDLAAAKSSILTELGLKENRYFVLTAHRQSLVDHKINFEWLLHEMEIIGQIHDRPIIYPIHPRSRKRINEFGLSIPPNIRLVDPLPYLDFLHLLSNTELIFTDSGGVQEEACVLEIPCITLRNSTERPETLDVGANVLCPPQSEELDRIVASHRSRNRDWENPFGDGQAGKRIIDLLAEKNTVHLP